MKHEGILKLILISTAIAMTACSSAPIVWNENTPIEQQAKVFIKDKNGDDFKEIKKVIIPYFQVEYVVKSSASATAFASGGSATAKQLFELKGVEDSHLQEMTNRYYENLVAALKSQGHEVIPHDQLLKMKSFAAFEKWHKPTPHVIERNNGTGKFFSYKGMPTYFVDGDKRLSTTAAFGSAFSIGKRPAALEEDLEKESGAKVLRARYVVDFVSQEGSKNAGVASVNSSYRVALAPEFTALTIPSESILVQLKLPLFTETTSWVKSVNEKNAVSNRAVSAVTSLMGSGNSTREYEIETVVTAWDDSVTKMVGATQKLILLKMQ